MLRRLCPVPSVRHSADSGGSNRASLSAALAAGTQDVHDSSDQLIRSKAALAFSDPVLWAALLSQFWHVYLALETALARAAATDARVGPLYRAYFSRLARADAFLADIAFHSRGGPPSPPLPPTLAFTARVSACEPLMLVAYAQTLYVALLAGGQTLSRMLRAARALLPGQGTAIFEFEAVLPAAEQRRFRDAMRDAVDALGTKLTAKERADLLAEKRMIFVRNDQIIRAVLAPATGSVAKAWALIALSVLRLPPVYARYAARRALRHARRRPQYAALVLLLCLLAGLLTLLLHTRT